MVSCTGKEDSEAPESEVSGMIEDENLEENRGMEGEAPMMEDDSTGDMEWYKATLSGSNEVPPVNTEATGTFSIALEGDSIHVKGEFSGLSSDYQASHIHKGGINSNGGPILTLNPAIEPDKRSGSLNASYELQPEDIAALRSDSLYINVHSSDHKPGEIRGQLTPSNEEM
ncbi:MAG: CHRD domain-containing protein [Balneolaceae bacterium]|nr:CHRD domain-containing protein [Balneolaceae bacterium]